MLYHLIGTFILLAGLAVHLTLAFWGPTLPTVKPSTDQGYVTTMAKDNKKCCGGCDNGCDPTDFTVEPAYEKMTDAVFDLAKKYGVTPGEVLATLAADVAEGDQR